ncbi:MAG: polyprenyl synthetase family protein, partial [Anaerovorax sp.]
DDILDVVGKEEETGKQIGKDVEKRKATYPGLYGLEASKAKLQSLTNNAIQLLEPYYDNAEFFVRLAQDLAVRIR